MSDIIFYFKFKIDAKIINFHLKKGFHKKMCV
jgi:hypothetical protein